MGLYDRDYVENYDGEILNSEASSSRIAQNIKDTYKLLTASMISATAGAFVAMQFGVSLGLNPIIYFVLMMGLIFAMNYAVNAGKETLALMLLFAFTFITGMTLGVVIERFIGHGMGHVVTQAFIATAVTFGALTVYAMNTKREFDSWGKPLFWSLIGVIVVSLLNYFIFKSSLLSLAISGFCALLFSFYIVYDTKNIINGRYDSPIMAAVGMYLNIYNLFMSLLNILGFANRE